MYEYENLRRVCYNSGAQFVPVCPNCGRFVKADDTICLDINDDLKDLNNATCKKCGRVKMPFEGFF